jgi:hypothetical protein
VIEIDETMLAFVRRHQVSLNWLFGGCLKGLSAMSYDAMHPVHMPPVAIRIRSATPDIPTRRARSAGFSCVTAQPV